MYRDYFCQNYIKHKCSSHRCTHTFMVCDFCHLEWTMFSHRRLWIKVLEQTLRYQESYVKPYHCWQKFDQWHHSHVCNPIAQIRYKSRRWIQNRQIRTRQSRNLHKNVSMRMWVTISEVNEAITAKNIAKLYTYSPEVWPWFKKMHLWDGMKNAALTSKMV